MDQWYIAKDGQQEGPVTSQQIGALVKAGTLDPATTLVWREGLTDWKTLGESGILAATGAPRPVATTGAPRPAAAVPASTNPYAVTERTRSSLDQNRDERPVEYPGYGRLRYILTSLVLTIVCYAIIFAVVFAMFGSNGGGGIALVVVVLALLMIGGSIYIGLQRLKNLGMSGWAFLWLMVPFMNIWIGWRMLACPAGYEDHRTLDTPAKVITGIWIGLMLLPVAVAFLAPAVHR